MLENTNTIIYNIPYWQSISLTFLYFMFLYFFLAPLFLGACKYLYKKGKLEKIIHESVSKKQLLFEKLHSLKSIVIFSLSVPPILFLIRNQYIVLLPDTITNIIWGLFVLFIWNEFHFFIVHRFLHLPYFMKKVHNVHHKSRVPTVYSVYSFHWFEAFLLSTVTITLLAFIDLPFITISLYPIISVLINYFSHCNYRFGRGTSKNWLLIGTNHNDHHYLLKKNYAVTFNIIDIVYVKIKNLSKKQIQ